MLKVGPLCIFGINFLSHESLSIISLFSFTSDLRDEIIVKHKSDILEGLIRVDPGIADVTGIGNFTLLHQVVVCNSTSCAEVLLKLAPHLFDIVGTSFFNRSAETPLLCAKRYYPNSREVITMLEDHLKNR